MNFTSFIDYYQAHIEGDEKGEAQIFLDRFFMALGYPDGLKGAGADCEYRIRNEKKKTSFADLVWKPRVLIEMKKSSFQHLSNAGFKVDYIEIANAHTLELLNDWDGKTPMVALAAAFLDNVRLIDNMLL